MKANLLKKYWKQFLLLLFLSLNISVNFTPKGITVDVNQLYAQESAWATGLAWLDNLVNTNNMQVGTYVNNGGDNWTYIGDSYCPDCAYNVNIEEVIIYGTAPSNTPVNLEQSDLWHSIPAGTLSNWKYWNYIGSGSWTPVPSVPDPDPCAGVTGALTLVDGNNPSRIVGTGQTLVMVSSGSSRNANISLSYQPSTLNSQDFIWSGDGTDGYMSYGWYSGSSNSAVNVQLVPGCSPVVGQINIVPENKYDLSAKIGLINTNLQSISQTAKNLLSSLSSNVNVSVSVTGAGEYKNVDKYADGTSYGKYLRISLGAQGGFSLPDVKTPPIYVFAGLYVQGTLKPGVFTASGTVDGIYDESKSYAGDIQGTFSVGLADLSFTAALEAGNPELLCAGVNASLGLKSLKVSGTFDYNNNAFVVTPKYELNKIEGTISLTAKYTPSDLECSFDLKTYTLYSGYNGTGSPITLFTLN